MRLIKQSGNTKNTLVLLAGLLLLTLQFTAHADVTFVHTDHLGTPVAYSDGTGAVIGEEATTPFGESLNPPTSDDLPAFTGHVRDGSTGLVYMQARYYDPVVGRFLSIDPVKFGPDKLEHFNRYWYANGNPITVFDPTGGAGVSAYESSNLHSQLNSGPGQTGGHALRGGTSLPTNVSLKNSEVNIKNLNVSIRNVLQAAGEAYESKGVPAVITSGNDGAHSANSMHYEDNAIDLRGNTLSDKDQKEVADQIQEAGGSSVQVISEYFESDSNDHIHIEVDTPASIDEASVYKEPNMTREVDLE